VLQGVSVADLFSLKGRVALVTGAKRGIGRAIALTMAEAGADVAVCDVTLEDGELQDVAKEIKKMGRRSLAIKADVSQKPEVDDMVQKVIKEFGAIDILVNNAGISGVSLALESPEKQWQGVLGVNLTGCYLCSYEVGKIMMERKKGNIVNIASVEAFTSGAARRLLPPEMISELFTAAPAITGRPYNISKAGIVMLTRVFAKQLAEYGIRVNAIAPGAIKTEMLRMLWTNPDLLKEVESRIPLGRIADPKEMANVALFLASDASSYVTGHTLVADGGMLA
jgi:NAD(P)-dependent dehydrogenase (short-subunit alcohol dehydrogenase family)